jgi:hypothetical protein
MIEVELQIPADAKSDTVVKVVEQICAENRLICTLKGTLTTYPGCIHWHFKPDKQKGTLEITWWESENRLWFKAAKGRMGGWIEESIAKLKKQIESSL